MRIIRYTGALCLVGQHTEGTFRRMNAMMSIASRRLGLLHPLRHRLGRNWPIAVLILGALLTGCATRSTPSPAAPANTKVSEYIIGPGDTLKIFVWGNADLSTEAPVRPDGKISTPAVEDLVASGKTPTQLGREIEKALSKYINHPVVTVIVKQFAGPYSQQIRVIGEAAHPQALAYREHMTVLDVMIAVGGLTEFAAGNRATVVRQVNGQREQFGVRLADLVKDGDISANVVMQPGDILIIPESWF